MAMQIETGAENPTRVHRRRILKMVHHFKVKTIFGIVLAMWLSRLHLLIRMMFVFRGGLSHINIRLHAVFLRRNNSILETAEALVTALCSQMTSRCIEIIHITIKNRDKRKILALLGPLSNKTQWFGTTHKITREGHNCSLLKPVSNDCGVYKNSILLLFNSSGRKRTSLI